MTPKLSVQNSRAVFLDMLRQKRPAIYAQVMRFFQNRGLAGLGEDVSTEANWWDKLVSSVQTLAPTYAQYQLSKDLYNLNLERARQGLPPIDASAISPQVQVGLSRDTRMLVFGLGAVALVAVFALARKKR